MKKLLLIAVLAVGFVSANAQKVELIPKAGISINRQDISGKKTKVGFQGGMGVNITTGLKNFSVQPELNYVQKGTKIKGVDGKSTYKFNYLEVPVLAKYSFGPVYVDAGPSLGLRIARNDNAKTFTDTKRLDFGVQGGLGVAVPAGPGKIVLDGRYDLGLTKVGEYNGDSGKNRGCTVSLGYAIPF